MTLVSADKLRRCWRCDELDELTQTSVAYAIDGKSEPIYGAELCADCLHAVTTVFRLFIGTRYVDALPMSTEVMREADRSRRRKP